jgi:hypothetical protein
MKRYGVLREMWAAILFPASDAASCITVPYCRSVTTT